MSQPEGNTRAWTSSWITFAHSMGPTNSMTIFRWRKRFFLADAGLLPLALPQKIEWLDLCSREGYNQRENSDTFANPLL
jgi:hypothetical protein